MKVTYTRKHKVRPADYESLDFGASFEIDTEDEEYEGETLAEIKKAMVKAMDDFLDTDIDRAVRLGGTMDDSHLWEFYDIEETSK